MTTQKQFMETAILLLSGAFEIISIKLQYMYFIFSCWDFWITAYTGFCNAFKTWKEPAFRVMNSREQQC